MHMTIWWSEMMKETKFDKLENGQSFDHHLWRFVASHDNFFEGEEKDKKEVLFR
jgi:hypothetical protein